MSEEAPERREVEAEDERDYLETEPGETDKGVGGDDVASPFFERTERPESEATRAGTPR
jgi:hypothetical protein